MNRLLTYPKRTRIMRLSQVIIALFIVGVSCMLTTSPARAADVELKVAQDGSLVTNRYRITSEVTHAWRKDVVFTSLTQESAIREKYTVRITSNIYPIDVIDPKLYAIHGGRATLLTSTQNERIWSISAPSGSQVTIVSEVASGILPTSFGGYFLNILGKADDSVWLFLSLVIPALTLVFQIFRRKHITRHSKAKMEHLHPELLRASPAALTVLWRGFVSRRATAASLIDLARRGHIQILVRPDALMLYRRESRDPLRTHETQMLVRWFGKDWNSKIHLLSNQNKKELINSQSTAVNMAVYDEVNAYGWFDPPAIISHWRVLLQVFIITIVLSISFFILFVNVPSATSLLWFIASLFASIGIIYTGIPTHVKYTPNGKQALALMTGSSEIFKSNLPIQASQHTSGAWEYWLPLAMVLGESHTWLKRWYAVPFRQPDWLLTAEPIRDLDHLLAVLDPVLSIASESIRDKILPAYL